MGEILKNAYEVTQADEDRAVEVFGLIEDQLVGNMVSDPIESAFLQAMYGEFLSTVPERSSAGWGRAAQTLVEACAIRRQRDSFFPPGYALRSLEFSVDKQMRRLFDSDAYPASANSPDFWSKAFRLLDLEELLSDMQYDLQSNMADTGAIYQVLLSKLNYRWDGRPPTVLDNGISLGQPWKKMFTTGFQPIRALRQLPAGRPIVPEELEMDDELQSLIDPLYDLPPAANQVIGYDRLPIISGRRTAAARDYIGGSERQNETLLRLFSQTFPFSESLRRKAEAEEFWKLALTPLPSKVAISRLSIDASDPESVSQLDDVLLGVPAEVGIFQAVLYEHPRDMAIQIVENVKPYIDDYVIITDFIKTPRRRKSPPGAIHFDFIRGAWWQRPGSFATYIVDLKSEEKRLIEIARYTDRRASQALFTTAGERLLRYGRLS